MYYNLVAEESNYNRSRFEDEPEEAWALTDRALTEEERLWIPISARTSLAPMMAFEVEEPVENRIPVAATDLLTTRLEKLLRLWNANAAFPLTAAAYVDDCIIYPFVL